LIAERTATVRHTSGLHARPAAEFVKLAGQFRSLIRIMNGQKQGNAKSMLSLLSLGISQGTTIRLVAEGEDAEAAVAALAAQVEEVGS
jgi:phosphocarrier protein HPr